MAINAQDIASRYVESWKARDFDAFRSLLADDVTFDGSLGHARNADEYVAGIEGMSSMVTDIVVHKMCTNGSDVVTWFDLCTADAGPLPTANWSHVENGRITRIQVAFDPWPLFGDSEPGA